MTKKQLFEGDKFETYLPQSHYRLRIIMGLGISFIAGAVMLGIVIISNSVSGNNIVVLYATLITFSTFVLLTIADPFARATERLDVTALLLNLGVSLVVGVLSNLLHTALVR